MKLPIALLLLLACAPVTGQDDQAEPYFSLTSSRTFSPGEKPSVQLSAANVEALEFRLYKLRDPLKFFQQLDDIHQFGGRAPRPGRAATPLERFHRFKLSWQGGARGLFRMQFSGENRARIRAWSAPKPAPRTAPMTTAFVAAPVLNPEQLTATWRQPVTRGRHRWDMQTVPIEPPGKGVFVVEAVHRELRAYTLLMVSDLAMVVKTSPGRLAAAVVERVSGAPVPRCPVMLRVDKEPMAALASDADGLVNAAVKNERPENAVVVAHRGDDYAVAAPPSWYLGTDPARYTTGYVYSDRPVYRPGHPVHFKAIVRTQMGSEYRIPTAREASAEVKGPDDKTVFRKTLSLSAAGTVSGDFELPAAAALGYYNIELKLGESEVHGGFEVQEYRKPEYEVRVAAEKRRVLQGEPVPVLIDARYYFGEPVANAKVTWVAYRSRYWHPMFEPEDRDESEDRDGIGGEQVDEQTGTLDAEGRLRIQVPTALWEHDAVYRIQARVIDQANREISGSGWAIATRGSFLVRITPEQYVYAPGARARFRIEARDYDGKPVETPVQVELRQWRGRKPGAGPAVFTGETRTDAAGNATVEALVPAGGSWRARAWAQTPERREVADFAYVWSSGMEPGEKPPERVELVPDRKSYKPGETARILIVTGAPEAHVLFTVEGRELQEARMIRVSGPSITVEVPVRASHQPNFFVNAAFVRGSRLYSGSKSVRVPPLERRIAVDLQPGKPQYKPGEAAEFTVTARDHEGKPVAAEFSLGVVDEALYGVQKDMTPDIVSHFYGNAYNRVGTDSSLSYYFTGEAGKRRMMLAAVRPRGALAQLKPERLVQPKVRKAFPDTVYWAAHLNTDASGRARAKLEFPDSLTTWRATARGVTPDTRVGSAVAKTIVRKNLILRLAAPRFYTEGDEATLSAIVQNYLAEAKTARVSLEAKGLEVVDGAPREVRIEPHATARVDFRVKAAAPGEAVLLGKALTDEESDALEIALPVNPYGVKVAEARAGTGDTSFDLAFPASASPRSRRLEITVTPSPAGSLFGALEFLTSFPYGCTEQTMSSFLPNLVVAKALNELKLKSPIDRVALDRKIRAGLDRLYEFQHDDGGWGWWQTDESQVFMTAYVLAGLAQARAAGQKVRGHAIETATGWLRTQKPRGDLAAYVAYALALAGAREAEAAWNARAALSPYGLALVGLAMDALGDARAGEAAAQLEGKAQQNETEAWWPLERDPLMAFTADSTPEATAYALKLLVRRRPQSPLIPKAAAWLPAHRREGLWWDSTKQTAMVIYGLTDYLKMSGELQPDLAVAVEVNGKSVLERRFAAADALAPSLPSVRIDGAASNTVRIRASGPGRLYWSVRAEHYSPDARQARRGGAGLNVVREYFRLVPQKEGDKIVHRIEPLAGPLAPGDVLAARLTVSAAGEWRYLMMEDPIPAGFELMARDDLYELRDPPPWWRSFYTRRELRDDRAANFDAWFPSGQKQFFYLMKAVNPGRYRVSPARVEPMYQPREQATTEGVWIEVR